MAVLTTRARNRLPAKEFAGPDRSFPIPDESHARNALARASQHASPALEAKIRAKVHRKFPGIEMGHASGGPIVQCPHCGKHHYLHG